MSSSAGLKLETISNKGKGEGGSGNYYGSIETSSSPSEKKKKQEKRDEEEPLLKTIATEKNSKPNGDSIDNDWSPIENAPWYSKLVFSWLNPLFRIGNEQDQLSPENIASFPLLPSDTTTSITDLFEKQWCEEKKRAANAKAKALKKAEAKGMRTSMDVEKSNPSLSRCLWRSFGWDFCKAGFLKAMHDVLQFVGPQVLHGFIGYIRDANAPLSEGLTLTAAVSLAQILMSFALRHYFFICFRVGLKTRTCIVTAIYKKALILSSRERGKRTVGEITNLMSVDSQRIADTATYLHAIWYSVLQIGLSIFFLWQQLGVSCMSGVVVICIMMPVTKEVAGYMGRLQKQLMKAKDKRIEAHNEVFGSMKVIKIQGWEETFQERIEDLRKTELRQLFKYIMGRCLNYMLWTSVPLFIALATFATYVLLGNTLDVATALTALALFEILRFPLFMLPNIINSIVEASVSLSRIESFLLGEEQTLVGRGNLKDVGINIDSGTFVYDSKRPKMMDLNSSVTKNTKNDKKQGSLADIGIAKELDDSKWELQLLRSQLADAENKIRELLKENDQDDNIAVDAIAGTSEKDNDAGAEEMSAITHRLLSLRRIDFKCSQGELIAVVGAVGSGKSTLINSLLGDIRPVTGEVSVNGKMAYFAQNPFVMNDTVKGNILFGSNGTHTQRQLGSSTNVARYRTAIESCALEHDLEALPNGDMCEIGEKGVTLSGGQKARVAMARCVYHDADIYLLDDPLAAVDAHVGRHLFEKCIVDELILGKGSVWSNRESTNRRIVILVTNALQYLRNPHVSRIVVLKNGAVEETGSYQELTSNPKKKVFKSFLSTFNESSYENTAGDKEEDIVLVTEDEEGEPSAPIIELDPDSLPSPTMKFKSQKRASLVRHLSMTLPEELPSPPKKGGRSRSHSTAPQPSFLESGRTVENSKLSNTDELQERSIGNVNKDIYLAWLRAAGGIFLGVLIPLFYLGAEGLNVLSQWWLTYWSGHGDEVSQLKFLAVYAIINFSAVLAMFIRMVVVMTSGLRASDKLFSRMLDVTLKAPMSFFDVTPLGRIMNRFSKDIYTLDEQLPSSVSMYLSTVIKVLGVLVVISSVTPIFTACLIPIVVYYSIQQEFFKKTYRELKRLDSVSRSPIYALFQETLDGISTIRAFSAQSSLLERITLMLDKQQNAYFLTFSSQCWLGVRLELVGTLVVSFACLCAVYQHRFKAGDEIYAGLAGLSISFALSVTQSLNWSVRMSSELEANMVAVERIEQYAHIESEAARRVDKDKEIGSSWPSNGAIELKAVKMRYRPGLPLVLKGLNLVIPSHSKVGIVGRTGAGKSSLMVALLRIVEIDSGSLYIDGVDIRSIGLQKLRSRIAVIPQDPSLFSGSVRSNLDPFDEYSDNRLQEVLIRVGLMSDFTEGDISTQHSSHCVRSLADEVIEGGSNFSIGQKQLLVIARALLRESNIVIMDEATAAVDADTDAMIQRVMRIDFKDATCLTIAHRLNTIMDSDYILVMDNGIAAEFDPPSDLMLKGGLFKDLVDTWEEDKKK